MNKISIKYGITASLLFILWVLIEHALGFNTTKIKMGEKTRLASAFVFYLFIIICIWKQKQSTNGHLSIAQGMKTGTIMVIIYGMITAIWLAVYQHFINPSLFENMMLFTEEKLKANNATPEEADTAFNEIKMIYSGSVSSYFFYFLFSSIIGCVVVLLVSLFLHKKSKTV